jgi:GNAT superfamily N-acetyltransferase
MDNGEIIHDEVEETFKAMGESIIGINRRTYFVAEASDRQVIGVIGITAPDKRLHQYIKTNNPVELINAFVHPNHRRKGVGKALVKFIENYAKNKGYTEIILTSGPRYQFSGWEAWIKLFGSPIVTAKNYFDRKYPAKVWGKIF